MAFASGDCTSKLEVCPPSLLSKKPFLFRVKKNFFLLKVDYKLTDQETALIRTPTSPDFKEYNPPADSCASNNIFDIKILHKIY